MSRPTEREAAPHMDEREGILRVELAERPTIMHWDVWAYSIGRKVEAGYSSAAIRRDNADNLARYKKVDPIRWEALAAMLGGEGNG